MAYGQCHDASDSVPPARDTRRVQVQSAKLDQRDPTLVNRNIARMQ